MWLWFDLTVVEKPWLDLSKKKKPFISKASHDYLVYLSPIFFVPRSGPEKIRVTFVTATGRNSPAYWRREKNSFLVLTHIHNMWSRCSWDERDLSLCVLNGGYFGRSDQACFIMLRHYSPLEMEGYGRGEKQEKWTEIQWWSNMICKGSVVSSHSPHLLSKQVFAFTNEREKKYQTGCRQDKVCAQMGYL